jgi:hypothetical protein
MNDPSSALVSSALIFYLQQWLKERAPYQAFVTAMPGADKWAHRIVAGLCALVAAAGIHYTFDGACSFTDGCRGTFSIPDGWTVLSGIWEWAKVYIGQQALYDITRTPRPSSSPSTAHTIERADV